MKRAVGGHKDKAVADQVLTTAGGLWNESAALESETTIEINKATLCGSYTDTKSTREEVGLQLLRRDGRWRFRSKGATWLGRNVVAERWCGVSSKMKAFRSQCTIKKTDDGRNERLKKRTTSEDRDRGICRAARVQKRVLCRRRESKDRQQWRRVVLLAAAVGGGGGKREVEETIVLFFLSAFSQKKIPSFPLDLFPNLIGFPATLNAASLTIRSACQRR